jgi:hypothetical protein
LPFENRSKKTKIPSKNTKIHPYLVFAHKKAPIHCKKEPKKCPWRSFVKFRDFFVLGSNFVLIGGYC